jgi:CheY-like chemotaxis protein/HPt (histidine-containing phosphotransfer) domain-containing protein
LSPEIQKIVDAVMTKPIREQSLLDGFARIFAKSGQSVMPAEAPAAPEVSSGEGAPQRSLKVLLAEDHKINQRLALMLLKSAHHDVEIAENGEEAVAAVRKSDFDVVLMDVQMPVLDGVQATKQIRALPPPRNAVPIVALTAHAMAGAREEYLACGMDDYLSKPLEPDALFAALARASARGPATETGDRPAVSAVTIFDPVRIATLKRLLPDGELSDFVRMFLESLRSVGGRTEQFIATRAFDELAQEAHALAGTAGNVGAIWVAKCARELEHACKGEGPQNIAPAADALRQAVPETQRALERWLTSQTAPPPLASVG